MYDDYSGYINFSDDASDTDIDPDDLDPDADDLEALEEDDEDEGN